MNTKHISIFSSNYGWNIFHSKKNWPRYNQNNKLVCMKSACWYFYIVIEIEFTWQFLKNPHIIFHVTPSSGSRILPCGWTGMMNVIVDFSILQMCLMMRIWVVMMYILLTAIGLTPGGSSTVHIYTHTVYRTTKWNRIHRTYITISIHKRNNSYT